MKRTSKRIFIFLLSLFLLFIFINGYILEYSKKYIVSEKGSLEKSEVVIILGAKVYKDKLSSILQDRVDTAIEIYQAGKVKKILISGDHGQDDYDEVNAIKSYLLLKEVLEEDIFTDHAGFSTYDSMYRAKHIFGVESAIISTQSFHLPRSIYIARKLGIEAYGFPAEKRIYGKEINNYIRESFAMVKAWFDVNLNSQPKYLGEKILITGNSQASWDRVVPQELIDKKPIEDNFIKKLVEAAMEQTTKKVTYDPSYFQIDYPMGDIPENKGVCTDVIIRAYRKVNIDLQKKVHEDMAKNFLVYPKKWNLSKTDTNIDHRRVPNLQVFFARFGKELSLSKNSNDYSPGDIVAWDLGKGITHIGITTNYYYGNTPLVVHNIGAGPKLENMLFSFNIIGHYSYKDLDN